MKSSRKPPDSHRRKPHVVCWCGNGDLKPFSDDYLRCAQCETLVLRRPPKGDISHIRDEENDLYGKNYYLTRLPEDHGYPGLAARARLDLPERCLFWLRSVLKYKLPPARALELGSAHGGFVAMLRGAGFNATGLELSPWLAKFARRTFNVPTLIGPIEDQKIRAQSLDVIALMDVIEHLPDPLGTMRVCLKLLKPNGLLAIQTPQYPAGKTLKEMASQTDRFVEQLKPDQHLYLFSQQSIHEMFHRLGADHVVFEPAIFAHYDMFLVVSKSPLTTKTREEIGVALSAAPASRLIQCLLDADDQSRDVLERLSISEADRAARLDVIQQQGRRTTELETEVHRWLEESKKYSAQAQQSESLRAGLKEQASRLIEENKQAISRMTGLQADLEQERTKSEALAHEKQAQQAAFAREKLEILGQLEKVQQNLAAIEADYAARLEVIHQQGRRSVELEAEVHRWLEETKKYSAQAQQSESLRARLQADLEQERGKNEALTHEKQAQQAAFANEKLDLLDQLDKVRHDLAAVKADRTRMSADLATSADRLARLQADLEQERGKNEALTHEKQAQQAAFANEKLDLLDQLDKVRHDLAAVKADRTRMSADLATSADRLARLQADLEQERGKNEALTHEKQAQQAAFDNEKLDLLDQLGKVRHDLAAVKADRTRMSADLATSADCLARLQAAFERQTNTNESLTRDLHAAKEEIRTLTMRLDAQSSALDGTVKSLEAARARIRELQERLSRIEEHAVIRVLKACRLRPW